MHPVAFKGFLTLYNNSSMQLFFHLTLVSAGRRSGGMLSVTQCWSFPEGSTPAPPTPWWLWLPGTAHSPPYWSLVEGGVEAWGENAWCEHGELGHWWKTFFQAAEQCRVKSLPKMCLQMAKGDLDFLKERNMCSACCLCSVLTIDGGACSYKRYLVKTKFENVKKLFSSCWTCPIDQKRYRL